MKSKIHIMNFKINLLFILASLAIVLSITAIYKVSYPSKENKEENSTSTNINQQEETPKGEGPKIEIAHFMNRIQVFHNKLYFAGIAKNEKLAQFYLDEMEEEMGEIAEAGVFDVDAIISENIVTYGLKQIDWFRGQIKNDFTQFKSDFESFTSSCNSCHVTAEKEFIKIGIPTSPIFTNQIYNP